MVTATPASARRGPAGSGSEFLSEGKIHLDELISARLKLSDINDGMAALKKGEVARQVIAF